jgi:hypothetical protein
MTEEIITNRLSSTSWLTFDLEDIYPAGERANFDLAPILFQGLILREKDLKEFVEKHDWTQYRDKFVAIFCSCDAIVPLWAFLLVMSKINPYAKTAVLGNAEDLEIVLFENKLSQTDWEKYSEQKVIIKGCSKVFVPQKIYGQALRELQKRAKLIAFGEACSHVPIWKKSK